METPKKPAKKKVAIKADEKKTIEKSETVKPKSRFIDDDEEEEFEEPIDDLAAYESFEGLEDEEDF